uniref:CUT domain-containing protein n=1 Tax=Rhabditophanes sp. KR3021 TaxID=114890 RepID=A0AC35UAY5_9BILA
MVILSESKLLHIIEKDDNYVHIFLDQNKKTTATSMIANLNESLRNEIRELEISMYAKENEIKEKLLEFQGIKNNFLAEKDTLLNEILQTNLTIGQLQEQSREISVENDFSSIVTSDNDQSDETPTAKDNNILVMNEEFLKRKTSSSKSSSNSDSEYCFPVRKKKKDTSKNDLCHKNVKALLSEVEVGKVISLTKIGESLKNLAKTYKISQSDVGMHVMGLSAPRTSDFIHHPPPSFEKATIVEKENFLKMFYFLTNKSSLEEFWRNCKKQKDNHFPIKVLKKSDLYE